MSYTNKTETTNTSSYGYGLKYTISASGTKTLINSGDAGDIFVMNKVRSGMSNPLWRSQVKSGISAGTPYSLVAVRCDLTSPGTVVMRSYSGEGASRVTSEEHQIGFQRQHEVPTSYVSSFVSAENEALGKLYRKIEQQSNQWKSLNFFAEVSDVLRQFGNPAKALIAFTHKHLDRVERRARDIRKKWTLKSSEAEARKIRKEIADMVSGSYLEYCFGIAPLISDAEKAAEALARFNYEGDPSNNPALRAKVVGRGSSLIEKDRDFSTSVARYGGTRIVSNTIIDETSEARVQYICGLSTSMRADFGSLSHFRKVFGVTPEKIPAALWEAVPWSWLADYFSNVGDILSSFGVDTSSVKWISKTTTLVDTKSVQVVANVPATKERVALFGETFESMTGSSMGQWKVRRTVLTRTIPSSIGYPSFQVSLPLGDPHMDTKLTNLVAVLFQRKGTIRDIVLH